MKVNKGKLHKNDSLCISYCAGIAVLWFINHHCGVACKANFPICNVRGDSQGQV